jgi:hypothetical protein
VKHILILLVLLMAASVSADTLGVTAYTGTGAISTSVTDYIRLVEITGNGQDAVTGHFYARFTYDDTSWMRMAVYLASDTSLQFQSDTVLVFDTDGNEWFSVNFDSGTVANGTAYLLGVSGDGDMTSFLYDSSGNESYRRTNPGGDLGSWPDPLVRDTNTYVDQVLGFFLVTAAGTPDTNTLVIGVPSTGDTLVIGAPAAGSTVVIGVKE